MFFIVVNMVWMLTDTVENAATTDAMDDCSDAGLDYEEIQEMTNCQTYQN